jgi:hypothetical protein
LQKKGYLLVLRQKKYIVPFAVGCIWGFAPDSPLGTFKKVSANWKQGFRLNAKPKPPLRLTLFIWELLI